MGSRSQLIFALSLLLVSGAVRAGWDEKNAPTVAEINASVERQELPCRESVSLETTARANIKPRAGAVYIGSVELDPIALIPNTESVLPRHRAAVGPHTLQPPACIHLILDGQPHRLVSVSKAFEHQYETSEITFGAQGMRDTYMRLIFDRPTAVFATLYTTDSIFRFIPLRGTKTLDVYRLKERKERRIVNAAEGKIAELEMHNIQSNEAAARATRVEYLLGSSIFVSGGNLGSMRVETSEEFARAMRELAPLVVTDKAQVFEMGRAYSRSDGGRVLRVTQRVHGIPVATQNEVGVRNGIIDYLRLNLIPSSVDAPSPVLSELDARRKIEDEWERITRTKIVSKQYPWPAVLEYMPGHKFRKPEPRYTFGAVTLNGATYEAIVDAHSGTVNYLNAFGEGGLVTSIQEALRAEFGRRAILAESERARIWAEEDW